jgi:quercetin dioxygenase-like cupin family protein
MGVRCEWHAWNLGSYSSIDGELMSAADIALQEAAHKPFTPQQTHHFGGGVYAKEMHLPAGSFVVQHKHEFDHLSVLASGRVYVGVDEVIAEYSAPACILIKAGANHVVEAVTDAVWYCVHATDCADEDAVDNQLIEGA